MICCAGGRPTRPADLPPCPMLRASSKRCKLVTSVEFMVAKLVAMPIDSGIQRYFVESVDTRRA